MSSPRIGDVTVDGFELAGHVLQLDKNMRPKWRPGATWNSPAVRTIATTTLTTADLLVNRIAFDNGDAANVWTTPTAAQIVAAWRDPQIGDTFQFVAVNGSTTFDHFLLAGAGVTLKAGQTGAGPDGSIIILTSSTRIVTFRLVNVTSGTEAVDVY